MRAYPYTRPHYLPTYGLALTAIAANWAVQLSCVDLCNNIIAFLSLYAIILFLGSDAELLTFSARFFAFHL